MESTDLNARPADPTAAGGNIDQIRDIIFGAQMRDYDRRFSQLEERLLQDSANLRDEFRQRLSSLEEYMRREVEVLADRLTQEQRTRAAGDGELAGSLDQLGRTTDTRFADSAEEAQRTQRDLRGELARQASALAEELARKTGELGAALRREADELHARKADRAALGAMFADVAARLAEEPRRPNDA